MLKLEEADRYFLPSPETTLSEVETLKETFADITLVDDILKANKEAIDALTYRQTPG